MAKKPKVEMKDAGAINILKQAGVVNEVTRGLNAIAAAAGPGMEARVRMGRTRVRGTVTTSTRAARRAEATNQALTRAIDAARR